MMTLTASTLLDSNQPANMNAIDLSCYRKPLTVADYMDLDRDVSSDLEPYGLAYYMNLNNDVSGDPAIH